MFFKKTYYIGSYEVISVRNKKGVGIDFIPQKGGAINQLYLGEEANPIFAAFIGREDIEADPLYKQSLLFPFSSRLKGGKYSFEGNNYKFPINETEKNNALHGFLAKEPLELASIDLEEENALIKLVYNYDGRFDYYPFPFTINIAYTVNQCRFTIDCEVVNRGNTNMPYGFGWHPYFKHADDICIKMPKTLLQIIDKNGIVTGAEEVFSELSKDEVITEKYDSCFKFIEKQPHSVMLRMADEYKVELWQDETMGYIQLYTPAFNQIALEPLTSNIDALNNQNGLIILKPMESRSHRIVLNYSDE